MNHSCSFKISGWLEQSGRISCCLPRWLKITDEKSQQLFWSPKWLTVKDCVFVPFFSKPGGFSVELYRKSFALKNRFGNEASSPQPLKHFSPGKTSNACMLLAHRLVDLGMFTYNSLQASYFLSLYLHLSFSPLIFNNPSYEGSSHPQVGGGSV